MVDCLSTLFCISIWFYPFFLHPLEANLHFFLFVFPPCDKKVSHIMLTLLFLFLKRSVAGILTSLVKMIKQHLHSVILEHKEETNQLNR